jgi:hypothetical protein
MHHMHNLFHSNEHLTHIAMQLVMCVATPCQVPKSQLTHPICLHLDQDSTRGKCICSLWENKNPYILPHLCSMLPQQHPRNFYMSLSTNYYTTQTHHPFSTKLTSISSHCHTHLYLPSTPISHALVHLCLHAFKQAR